MTRLTAAEQEYFYQLFIINGTYICPFYRVEQFDDFCEPIIGFRPSVKYGGLLASYCFKEFLRKIKINGFTYLAKVDKQIIEEI